ncbi:hypothetical protein JB92DRAFT_2961720 [Gautieria morchelliformis]|nr:hypothetical protein JB92DRAFT_2961720 [Gautieria morchelliformis]
MDTSLRHDAVLLYVLPSTTMARCRTSTRMYFALCVVLALRLLNILQHDAEHCQPSSSPIGFYVTVDSAKDDPCYGDSLSLE